MQVLLHCSLVLFFVSVKGQQLVDDITISTQPQFLKENGEFRLICMCDMMRYTFQYWVHPNPQVSQLPQTMGRFMVQRLSAQVWLTMSETRQSDEGEYKCVFSNSGGGLVAQSTSIEYIESIVFNTANETSYRHNVGESATLLCDVENYRSVQWQYPGSNPVPVAQSGRIRVVGTTNLHFTELELADSRDYLCVAVNEVETKRLKAHLVVYVYPQVSITPPSALVRNLSSVTFTCEARGSPRPNIIWTKDNPMSRLETSPRIRKETENVSEFVIRQRLIFTSVLEEDTGTYRCDASNINGSITATTSLQLLGTPSVPQQVELTVVNRLNINVSWSPPLDDGNLDIDSYTVIWQAVNGSHLEPLSNVVEGPNQTHYLISELERRTTYMVSVHASNMIGRGRGSNVTTITTDATVPAAPAEIFSPTNISPTSVRISWTLSLDDGGAMVTTVRIYYRASNETWEQALFVDVSASVNSAQITGLRGNTTYELRVEAGNRIGFGAPSPSITFHTPLPGSPGSPSLVVAKNLTEDAAVVCWVPSDIGQPFSNYTVQAHAINSSAPGKVWTFRAQDVHRLPNGSEAVYVDGLAANTCYQFVVSALNSHGASNPSSPSRPFCTLPYQPCVFDDCPGSIPVSDESMDATSNPVADAGLRPEIVAVLVICSVIGVICLIIAVLLLWKISARLKYGKTESYTFSNGTLPLESERRDSSRSDRMLLEYNTETEGFHRQSSAGNTSSLSSQPSTTVFEQEHPTTATTLLSNNFSYTPPVSANICVSNDYPQEHVYPQSSPWHYPPPPAAASVVHSADPEEFHMMDNPLNRQFEEEKRAELEWSLPQNSYSRELDELAEEDMDDNMPPPIPPYRGDDISLDSDPPSNPPFLGESFSQPSPGLRREHEGCGFYIPGSNQDEETEFTDNQVYEGFTPNILRRGQPRFAITASERGAVFETVNLRY